jgi:hypothetical protein
MKKSLLLLVLVALFQTGFAQNNNYNHGWGGERVKGSGPVVKETRDAKNFTGFKSGISADIFLKQSSGFKVTIEGQKNILDLLTTEVKDGGMLSLGFKKGYNIQYNDPLKVYIEAPSFTYLGMSGSGNVINENALTGKMLEIKISGSGDFDLSKLQYEDMSIGVSGSGDIKAENLKAKKVKCSISGSGDINCNAAEVLEASVSGSGDIKYSGKPASVKSRVSGSGDIESRDK